MRIPSFAMVGSVKEIAVTFCFIGLMAGSLCVESIDGQRLNQQDQEKVPTASTRRRLLPQLSRIHHPAPPAPKQNFLPSYSPSRPAPKELSYAPPATPTSKESYALPGPPAATQNQGEVDNSENPSYSRRGCGAWNSKAHAAPRSYHQDRTVRRGMEPGVAVNQS